jgi:hypothetical protein
MMGVLRFMWCKVWCRVKIYIYLHRNTIVAAIKNDFNKKYTAMIIPSYSIRFYIRINKKQRGDTLTPLRLKVWITDTKSYLYVSTPVSVTPNQWKAFDTEGNPGATADPAIAREVDTYRAAAQLVLSSAIVNNRVSTLTSEYLKRRVDGVVGRMKANKEHGVNQPIMVFCSPKDVSVCEGCKYRNDVCAAPWSFGALEADTAADFAAYNGACRMKQQEQKKGGEA